MGGAHAAADQHVIADHVAVLDDGDVAEVMGEHVDVVLRRHRNGDLEFAGQIGGAVDRLGLQRLRHLLVVDENLPPGAALRQQMGGDVARGLLRLGIGAASEFVRRAHHVAVHVAAGGDGVQQHAVDLPQGRAQIGLDDAMELDRLARGDAQGLVAALIRQFVHRQILRAAEHAAGHAQARHEAVGLVQLALGALRPQVAIILQIDAVKLDQLLVVFGNRPARHLAESLGEGAAQKAAVGLDGFVMREFWRLGGLVSHWFVPKRSASGRGGRCQARHVDAAFGLVLPGPAA